VPRDGNCFVLRVDCAYPGGAVELELRIDGENAGFYEAGVPRPDVGKVFAHETAGASGFRAVVPIQEPTKRPHAIVISELRKPVPLCATFFAKR
jgi:hypothetical protein